MNIQWTGNATERMTQLAWLAIALLGSIQTTGADDFSQIMTVGGLVLSNPGTEMAVPFLAEQDTNGDGMVDQIHLRMCVKDAMTGEQIHDTQELEFDLPSPCTNPYGSGSKCGCKLIRMPGSTRAHFARWISVTCVERSTYQVKQATRTIVYSADLSTSTPDTVWGYASDLPPVSIDMADFDGDGFEDVILTTYDETAPGTRDLVVRAMDAATGELIRETTEPLVRP